MTDQHDPSDKPRREAGQLSERLRRLEDALVNVRRKEKPASTGQAPSVSDAQGLARALRMSSEFVAGIVVGAGLGWFLDRLLGTSPWGMIILLMLGFAAGVLNVMRAAGMSGPAPPSGG